MMNLPVVVLYLVTALSRPLMDLNGSTAYHLDIRAADPHHHPNPDPVMDHKINMDPDPALFFFEG